MPVLAAISLGFATGVFLRSLFVFAWPVIFFPLIPAALCAAGYFFKSRLTYASCALFFVFFSFGMLRVHIADTPLPESFRSDLRHRVSYEGVIVRDPDIRETTQRVAVHVIKESESTTILAVAPHHPSVQVGERVLVTGTLFKPEPFETDGGRTFRYDKYLQKDGISFILNFARIQSLEEAHWYSLPATLARIKHTFLSGLSNVLPRSNSALAGGIVIGGRVGLSKTLHDAFITSGLVHIIVLSGYNVMIVAEWMIAGFALITRSRRLQALAGVIALLLFVGIAGFSSAASRATLMALIALYARTTGRTYAASRALVVAVFIMLVWNPMYLAFDPGFGLSVTATAGLIWLSPIFEAAFMRTRTRLSRGEPNKAQRFWITATSATLAAQTGVLPLLIYNTGNLSIVALPANLLVVAVMPLTMAAAAITGIAGVLFGSFVPPIAALLSLPTHLLTSYIIFVAEKTAALPFAAVTVPAFSFLWVITSYAALVLIASSKRFSTTDQSRLPKKAST